MADRRRRDGFRAGAMSDGVRAALDAEVARLLELDDPVDRIRAVGDFNAALDVELEKVAQVRLEAVAELRARGMTYERIADQTGLSLQRVAQLARAIRASGRVKPTPPQE